MSTGGAHTGYGQEGIKAGMCDAAWCAPCTWAPLRWQCLLGALYQVRPFTTTSFIAVHCQQFWHLHFVDNEGQGSPEGRRSPEKFCRSYVQIRSFWHKASIIYTVRHKKHTKILLCITSRNINWFSKFFHWWIQEEICYKSFTTCPTTPHRCCCTTM